MDKATGILLVILGAWLVVATLAGRLAERILSTVWPDEAAGPALPDPRDPDPGTPGPAPGRPQFESWIRQYFPVVFHDWAFRVVECESGWDPDAVNPISGASGLFQHMPQFWADRSRRAGWEGADIFDPEANIAVAKWLLVDAPEGGPHHWVCS